MRLLPPIPATPPVADAATPAQGGGPPNPFFDLLRAIETATGATTPAYAEAYDHPVPDPPGPFRQYGPLHSQFHYWPDGGGYVAILGGGPGTIAWWGDGNDAPTHRQMLRASRMRAFVAASTHRQAPSPNQIKGYRLAQARPGRGATTPPKTRPCHRSSPPRRHHLSRRSRRV